MSRGVRDMGSTASDDARPLPGRSLVTSGYGSRTCSWFPCLETREKWASGHSLVARRYVGPFDGSCGNDRTALDLSPMRIISVRVSAVANVLALVYALVGIVVFANYEMGAGQSLTLPVGIVAPFLNLNLNVKLARSLEGGDFGYGALFCAAAVLSYALTGWLTGLVAAVCFNVMAKWTGGIDAKYVSVTRDVPRVGTSAL